MTTSRALKNKLYSIKHPSPKRPKKLPLWMTNPYSARLQADRLDLERRLNATKIAALHAIRRKRGWKIKETVKSEIAGQLAARMCDADDYARVRDWTNTVIF